MPVITFVTYVRVSTNRQEQSGLGVEAQREAVQRYASHLGAEIVAEFVETESGAKANRPLLAEALSTCRRTKSTLLLARLDRLSRSLSFVAQLLDANVEIRCADMPEANRLLLQLLAVFSEHERQLISERTKAALAAAKAKGVILGAHGKVLAKANKLAAAKHAESVRPVIQRAKASGCRTLSEIAAFLDAEGLQTASGGEWHPMTVQRILKRIDGS